LSEKEIPARLRAVRRLLSAAAWVYAERARFAREVAAATGLTAEGVEAGFACLEREATDTELTALIASAGDAEEVHVILSANVFVAPLRALALARAASAHVTVRPSSRDPTLTRVLVAAADDDAIALTPARDVATVARGEIHVYGRDATIDAVRVAARPGVVVRGHGAGMGAAIVSRGAQAEAAAAEVASDAILFDQRGCLSPRVVVVEGGPSQAEAFAVALHECLADAGARVPRGLLDDHEKAESARWHQTLAFTGRVWTGADHAVGHAPPDAPLSVPPAGRHLLVTSRPSLEGAVAHLRSVSRFLVCVGTDAPDELQRLMAGVRIACLGRMQRPPLDGPVDRRSL
jgi:hypothetical protein